MLLTGRQPYQTWGDHSFAMFCNNYENQNFPVVNTELHALLINLKTKNLRFEQHYHTKLPPHVYKDAMKPAHDK